MPLYSSYIDEYRAVWPTQTHKAAYTHHTHCCRTNFFQTALRIFLLATT